jgi:hypothetical protein
MADDVRLHNQAQREAMAVANLRLQLAALDEESLDISIDSETSFNEVVDKVLEQIDERQIRIIGTTTVMDDLAARRARDKKGVEWLRGLLANMLEIAGVSKAVRPRGTVSLGAVAPKAIVTEEADIPSRFFTPQPPALDQRMLTEALRARADALNEAAKMTGEEREEAMKLLELLYPQVPGATLSNGGRNVTIRRK